MSDDKHRDIIDQDLVEDIDEEEMYEIIQENKQKIRDKEQTEKQKPKRPFPKWVFWLIAVFMLINIIAYIPNFFSLAAIDFVKTSAQLLVNDDVKEYKKSIALINIGDSKGTGFVYTEDGHILTNHHVVDKTGQILVYLPDDGPYSATVEERYPEIDLAVLKIEGENFPKLDLANQASFDQNEHIYFIGNPLSFSGIANEGEIIGWSDASLETEVMMLKAPVYRGNSGSPVINQSGKVIGVIYATRQSDEHGKVGLAIPIDAFHQYKE
ncbi:S1C family serine protease [Piscibacillus salipiscarius]|uniref:S1C family serine protease n=1 Tax=Piscibacillus salipiscarius TaxID=299480 RepID=A0ABW5QCD8_9BACI